MRESVSGANRSERRWVAVAAALAALALSSLSQTACSPAGAEAEVTGICDAKKRAALDPDFEIPAEFDSPWPSLEACLSYDAASDPEAPGPLQPIAFSHKHHAGLYEIDCSYCHGGTEASAAAGVPSVELCMGCHSQFPEVYDQEFEGIRVLKEHWEERRPIEWEQIHRVPEHVQFRHNRHIAAGVDCQRCHGPVDEMDKLYLTEDTVWWPWLLPAQKLQMGWCIQCHRANEASQDCLVCHY